MGSNEKIAWRFMGGFCATILVIEVLLSIARAIETGASAGFVCMAQLLGIDLAGVIAILIVIAIVGKAHK